jgi:hypothetical protein
VSILSPRFIVTTILLAFLSLSVGCNRQDTDCLSRIGRKIATHAKNNAGDIGSKLDVSWAGAKKEPSLQEKVQDRLRFENTLTDVTLEVLVKEKEVELKGTVKTAQQRLRAIELAETLAGVDRVTDSIMVKETEEVAR